MATKSKPITPRVKPATGPEIIDAMAAAPSLDRFFYNKPTFSDAELREFIEGQRRDRAIWETKQK